MFDLLPAAGQEGATRSDVALLREDMLRGFERIEHRLDEQRHALTAAWRRDLLLVSGGQFAALAAAVLAVVTLG